MKIILLLLACVVVNSEAFAKKGKAHAFSYFDDGGKHSQGECDPEKKAPKKLKHKKDLAKYSGYMGSELIEAASESPKGTESWKHYFSSSNACNTCLKHQPMVDTATP